MGALHMAQVFGWPYRLFVALLGVAVAMLSVTGVLIWLKKKRARQAASQPRTHASIQRGIKPSSLNQP
jgi:uncharacterized iron-regulated membrane protein